MQWPKDSAGRRMTTQVPIANQNATVADVRAGILGGRTTFKTINYVYVLDDAKRLAGVLSIKELLQADPSGKMGDICKKTSLVAVRPDAKEERAAYLAIKNNIKAVPVTDAGHLFLGVLSSDTILTILHKEMHGNLLRFTGIRHSRAFTESILDLPLATSLWHRIPWLAIGLIGGLIAARIIESFESILEQNLILAAFIPLIVYMGDAVGTQMEACIIRDLALDPGLPFRRYFFRQLLIIGAIGLFFGGALAVTATFLFRSVAMGEVLGIALTAAVLSSVFTGLLVPYTASKFRLDPADASGPIATIIQDILSITIYFVVATALL